MTATYTSGLQAVAFVCVSVTDVRCIFNCLGEATPLKLQPSLNEDNFRSLNPSSEVRSQRGGLVAKQNLEVAFGQLEGFRSGPILQSKDEKEELVFHFHHLSSL